MGLGGIKETLGHPFKPKESKSVSGYIHDESENYFISLHNYLNAESVGERTYLSEVEGYIGNPDKWKYWQIRVALELVTRDMEKQQDDKVLRKRRITFASLQEMIHEEKRWKEQTISHEEQAHLDTAAKKLVKIPINELRKPQRSAETRLQLDLVIQDLEAAWKLHEQRTVSGNAGD